MKIIVIIADITRAGGTERATVNLVNMLSNTHDVRILSLGKKGISFFSINDTIDLDFLEMEEIPQPLVKKIRWYRQFYKLTNDYLHHHPAECIIGQGHNINVFLPFFKTSKAKVFACEHIDYASIPVLSKIMMKFSYPKLAGLVVLSDIAKSKLKDLNSNIKVIPNSLPFETEQISSQENNNLIMVGRISKEKGYERLIPIAKKLMTEFPAWKINIYGDGDLRDDLQNRFNEKELSNIVIHNPVKNIMEKYLESTVLLMTSYNEAMPMVILEANHCGLPVIGFRNEGTETLIKNTGFIADNDEEFYSQLKSLIENVELRKKLSNNARDFAEQYRAVAIERKWEKLLL